MADTREQALARFNPPEAKELPTPEGSSEGFLMVTNEAKQLTLPCAVKLLIKSVRNLNLALMDFTCDLTVILWVGLNGIEDKQRRDVVKKHILNADIKFRLNEQEYFMSDFKPNIVKPKSDDPGKEQTFAVTMRGTFVVPFFTDAAIASLSAFPFELMPVRMKFELTSFQVEDGDEHYKVRHDIHNRRGFALEQIVSLKSDADKLPEYDIAINRTTVSFEPEVKKTKKDGEVKYYPVMYVTLYLFRDPGHTLLTIVLPMFVINFITIITTIKTPNSTDHSATNLTLLGISVSCLVCLSHVLGCRSSPASSTDATVSRPSRTLPLSTSSSVHRC